MTTSIFAADSTGFGTARLDQERAGAAQLRPHCGCDSTHKTHDKGELGVAWAEKPLAMVPGDDQRVTGRKRVFIKRLEGYRLVFTGNPGRSVVMDEIAEDTTGFHAPTVTMSIA